RRHGGPGGAPGRPAGPRRRLVERLEHDSAPASADDRLNLVMSQPAERAGLGGGPQERKVDARFGGVLIGARLMLRSSGFEYLPPLLFLRRRPTSLDDEGKWAVGVSKVNSR